MLEERARLEAFRRGDQEVLAALFRQYAPEIARLSRYGFAFRSGGKVMQFRGYLDAHEQENLIQETFARAFAPEARRRYDGLTPYGPYLKRIAKNIVIDALRRQGRGGLTQVDLEQDALAELPDPEAVSSDQLLHRKRVAETVRSFVHALPERERSFLSCRYERGLSQDEVAVELGLGRTRVRTLERRVQKLLHRALRSAGLLEPLRRPTLLDLFVSTVWSAFP